MRYSCRFERVCAAPPHAVYGLLADVERWPQWLHRVRSAGWEPAEPAGGPGAVRRVEVGGLTMRERILVADPPHHHAYTIVSGLPVTNHRADVHFTTRPGGTSIVWTATFEPRIPFTGPLVWLVLRVTMPTMVTALARGADAQPA